MGIAQNLKRLRGERRISQAALAKASGVSQQLISQIENGVNVETKRLRDLAAALGVALTDLDPNFADVTRPRATVPLVGYVGAGAAAHYYAGADNPDEWVDAPEGATADTVAVQIRGDSLGTLFDQWLVFYDEVRTPVTPDLIGRLCVVGLPDDRVLVKRIRRAKTPGFFHLESNTEGTIYDVEVAWAARVKNMVPR